MINFLLKKANPERKNKEATPHDQETNPDGPVSFFEPVENPHSVQPLRASKVGQWRSEMTASDEYEMAPHEDWNQKFDGDFVEQDTMVLDDVKQEAIEAVTEQGHRMSPWTDDNTGVALSYCTCDKCGKGVVVQTELGWVDVEGEAVYSKCDIETPTFDEADKVRLHGWGVKAKLRLHIPENPAAHEAAVMHIAKTMTGLMKYPQLRGPSSVSQNGAGKRITSPDGKRYAISVNRKRSLANHTFDIVETWILKERDDSGKLTTVDTDRSEEDARKFCGVEGTKTARGRGANRPVFTATYGGETSEPANWYSTLVWLKNKQNAFSADDIDFSEVQIHPIGGTPETDMTEENGYFEDDRSGNPEWHNHDMSQAKHHPKCRCERCEPNSRPCNCKHCRAFRVSQGRKASAKPKCPECGSTKYGLMPTDFETAKCSDCGKNWEHGIVPGINDPNGEGSKTAAKGDITKTPQFKAWFSGSKVVNSKETPMVMYHATESDFGEFHPYSHFGTRNSANDRYKNLTEFYNNQGANIMPVYLSIKNPLRMPDLASIGEDGAPYPELDEEGEPVEYDEASESRYARGWEHEESVATTLLEMGVFDIDEFERGRSSNEEAYKILATKGYDGIVYKNVVEDAGKDSWIAFNPNQVKSAIGNNGEFNSGSNYITANKMINPAHPIDPQKDWYRVGWNSIDKSYGTAGDILRYEVEELGNENQNVSDEMYEYLDKFPATSLIWVGRTPQAVTRYLRDENGDSPEDRGVSYEELSEDEKAGIDEIHIPYPEVITGDGEDNGGLNEGLLVLMHESPEETKTSSLHFDRQRAEENISKFAKQAAKATHIACEKKAGDYIVRVMRGNHTIDEHKVSKAATVETIEKLAEDFDIPEKFACIPEELGTPSRQYASVQKKALPKSHVISLQEAKDRNLFGPVYHGTTPENMTKIDAEGFKITEGDTGSEGVRNGYEGLREYAQGVPAPIHHLGYGTYFTTVKAIAKMFNGDTTKGLRTFYLDVPRLETINFAAPNTMMKWWIKNGYQGDLARTDRVAATKKLTETLKSQFDAVWYKGKTLRKVLDGDQVVVFDPNRIYEIDPKLSKSGEIGSKVIRKSDGMKGTIVGIRPIPEDFREYHKGHPRFLEVKWNKGGREWNVYDSDVDFV